MVITTRPAPVLNERQRAILAMIRESYSQRKRPPTYREILVGLPAPLGSAGGLSYSLRVLQRQGLIEIDPGVARGIRLTGPGCPVCGCETHQA